MRLTERKVCYPKSDKKGNLTKVDYIEIKDKDKGLAEEKLCQLEDIEDELGIDLVTLFKALRNGYYYKRNGKIVYTEEGRFIPYRNELMVDKKQGLLTEACLKPTNGMYVFLRDYGYKWALTKEELL